MSFKVIAECVDERTGRRYFPGDTFDPPPSEEQAERLGRAGCVRVSDEPASRVPEDMSDAELVDELVRLFRSEATKRSREELLQAIRAHGSTDAVDAGGVGDEDLLRLKREELEALAEQRKVDVSGCRTKADVVAALKAAEQAAA